MNGFKTISALIFTKNKERLVISEWVSSENYVGEVTSDSPDLISDLDRINGKPLTIGILRDQFNLLSRLEDICQKRGVEQTPIDYPNSSILSVKYPVEKSFAGFMSSAPDFGNKFLFDFSKDFINRKSLK